MEDDMYLTDDEINYAYTAYATAKEVYAEFAQQVLEEKTSLDRQVARAMLDGTITGKNVAEREASAYEAFAESFGLLSTHEAALAELRLAYDLAGIEIGRVKSLLRLMENLQDPE
jgi:hypothetical protein